MEINGILNILKPPGMTSHDVVEVVRDLLKIKQVGHTGTLDPGASGVLVLCVGKATKLTRYIVEGKKVYRAEITFGVSTDTYDNYGKIVKTKKADVSKIELIKILKKYIGEVYQIPPMTSALKHKGKRLYELARKGIKVDVKKRKIRIYGIDLIEFSPPDRALIEVECSKGTYIRSLCNDIGEAVGCGAHMSFLVRKRVGPFLLKDSITLTELETAVKSNILHLFVLPLDYPLKDYPAVNITDEKIIKRIKNGNPIKTFNYDNEKNSSLVRIYFDDCFAAIGSIKTYGKETTIKPVNVFV